MVLRGGVVGCGLHGRGRHGGRSRRARGGGVPRGAPRGGGVRRGPRVGAGRHPGFMARPVQRQSALRAYGGFDRRRGPQGAFLRHALRRHVRGGLRLGLLPLRRRGRDVRTVRRHRVPGRAALRAGQAAPRAACGPLCGRPRVDGVRHAAPVRGRRGRGVARCGDGDARAPAKHRLPRQQRRTGVGGDDPPCRSRRTGAAP